MHRMGLAGGKNLKRVRRIERRARLAYAVNSARLATVAAAEFWTAFGFLSRVRFGRFVETIR